MLQLKNGNFLGIYFGSLDISNCQSGNEPTAIVTGGFGGPPAILAIETESQDQQRLGGWGVDPPEGYENTTLLAR